MNSNTLTIRVDLFLSRCLVTLMCSHYNRWGIYVNTHIITHKHTCTDRHTTHIVHRPILSTHANRLKRISTLLEHFKLKNAKTSTSEKEAVLKPFNMIKNEDEHHWRTKSINGAYGIALDKKTTNELLVVLLARCVYQEWLWLPFPSVCVHVIWSFRR